VKGPNIALLFKQRQVDIGVDDADDVSTFQDSN
jgi:hypothetical protein